MVRAKFRLDQISRQRWTKYEDGKPVPYEVQTLRFNPVVDGSPENKAFYAATPTGSIELGTVNADAVKQFELSKEYYIDFTPA